MSAEGSGTLIRVIGYWAAFVCGVIAVAACWPDEDSGQSDTDVVAYSDSLECPNHSVGLPGGDTILPIAGSITAIAEFHDCQRLIDHTNPEKYSTLASIWVHERLDVLTDSLQQLNPMDSVPYTEDPATGNAVADSGPPVAPGQRPMATGTGITFALVYAWEGPYEALSISKGWNCLRVFHSASYPESPRYAALIFPVADASKCEDLARAEDKRGMPLFVYDHAAPGFGEEDFPPVGRWEWDQKNGRNYMSLKCGSSWCDVTSAPPEGHGSSADYHLITTAPKGERKVWSIEGWYDEQQLDIPDPDRQGWLMPSDVTGTVVPNPALDTINRVEQFDGVWVPAAEIGMTGRLEIYEEKLNLDPGVFPGAQGRSLNHLYLCRDTGDGCPGVPTGLACPQSDMGDNWYAMIEPSGPGPGNKDQARKPSYYCVTRHDHSGLDRHIPGTARWWWVSVDAKLWMKCAEGCCTVR